MSVLMPIPKKGNAKECSNYHTITLISHTSKIMLKILQARLQQYVNCELLDVQNEFRKGRVTRDQIVNLNSCHLLFDHFQFALIHGPNIPGSYAIQHQTLCLSPVTCTTGCWFCLALSLHSFWNGGLHCLILVRLYEVGCVVTFMQ